MEIISLKNFIKTGCFGSVELEMSKEEVIDLLGQPEWYNDDQLSDGVTLIAYSWYEFFFTKENKLFAIQNDHFDVEFPESCRYKSEKIEIDPWIYKGDQLFLFKDVEEILQEEEITYKVEDYLGRKIIKMPSEVVIDFTNKKYVEINGECINEMINDYHQYELNAIWYWKTSIIKS